MTFEERKEQLEKAKSLAYYFIIALVSIISVVFLPMINSSLNGGFNFPENASEWAIFIMSKLLVAIDNCLIFYCFLEQAKTNVKNVESYINANKKLQLTRKGKELIPRSPQKYMKRQWLSKGITLFITSLLSTVVLGQAILSFDLATFLSYLFAIFLAVVFGYITMRNNEDYWTTEFPQYVEYIFKKEIENNGND